MKKKKKKPVKKVIKKPTSRSFFIRACKLWKAIAYDRDGRECQVQKHYPDIKLYHTKVYQVDHVITRKDTKLYFDPNNSLVVCSTCNRMKHLHQRGIGWAIYMILIKRIGQDAFERMMAIHQQGGPNRDWRRIEPLKIIVEHLENEYRRLKNMDHGQNGEPGSDQGPRGSEPTGDREETVATQL